ncbi:hypothetical protein EFA46_004105 [Halarchaeum sp. CBA1220]|uniref:hypothetical protein n=1 Tax=Halarchaeum sp. CBA1220 TaxID=1853682 RepID=UPI000F3A91C8|nr:hypothetical protein [Halarchaeum sp. CBA1220]QLC33417.1 hypothetical protein EFA46_004105 [Halarchaeum sp. CBA1220]
MPEIDIAAEQAEYLEELRAALAEEHLGEYGTMRTRDALQYLIDQHEASPDDGALGTDAGAAAASGGHDDGDASDLSVDDLPDETPAVESEAPDATGEGAGEDAEAADIDGDADDGDGGDADADAGGGGPSPLAQTMQLLEDNDDVWEEVESSDGKYAVTLPDGSTKHARTKDDVRALLFKHYR